MSATAELQTPAPPSLSKLAKTTVVAVIVASAILVAFVLPAEYGIDPLGTGHRLGLTQIAAPPAPAALVAPAAGAPLAPTQNGPIGEYPREFKFDVFNFVLEPYEYIEYKYQLEKGATFVYSWAASADVVNDFHGERAAGATDGPAEQSFDKHTRRQSTGSYTALFAGIHGWYWENPGGEPIKIRLSSAGFYTAAVEIHSNRTRHPHALQSLELLPAAPKGIGSSEGPK
jgi:hypothetical protein